VDSRLTSAQTALMMQEETIRRNERERKTLADKVNGLERALAAADTEKRQSEVSIGMVVFDVMATRPTFI
jgi:rootletin